MTFNLLSGVALIYSFFDGVKLTKNADLKKYSFSSYVIGAREFFRCQMETRLVKI